jgi:hypothetical protein
MDKENVHIYSRVLSNHKEIFVFIGKCVELKIIRLSEISQNKKEEKSLVFLSCLDSRPKKMNGMSMKWRLFGGWDQ